MSFGAQLVMLTGIGAMKSLISAEKLDDERLFRYAAPNVTHVPGGIMPDVSRSIRASPNVRGTRFRGAFGLIGSDTIGVLIAPITPCAALNGCTTPQHGAFPPFFSHVPDRIHRWKPSVGTVPPWSRSYLMRMSPAVRTGVTPLALATLD